MGDTDVLWKRIIVGAIVLLAVLAIGEGVVIVAGMFHQTKDRAQESTTPAKQEQLQQALESYETIQSTATTTLPPSKQDQLIKQAQPKTSTTDAQRQSALENYLQSHPTH